MTIPVLPDPPSRADPSSFVTRADAWNAAMQSFSEECNLAISQIDSSVTTVTSGMSATLWTAGTYAIGTLKYSPSTGHLYRRLIATASATEPAADTANWALMTVAAPTLFVVSGTTQTAGKGGHYEMTNSAASTLTLPAGPSVGDWVWVGFTNSRIDNVIARNSQPIMGVADDLIVDTPYAALILRYISAGFGWRVFK